MTMQNARSTPPLMQSGKQPLMRTPRPLATAEYNRLVAKMHNKQALTPQEQALMKAQDNWDAQQFLEALKAGVREGIETP